MVKSKRGMSIHSALQNAIVAAIIDPSYAFALPVLSDWESVVSCTTAEKQRLEFIGDAVMHLSVALYLYQLFPDAAPGLYTNIRSAVNTNATFTHLMIKSGAYELPSQSQSTKAAADSFEVIVAALYMERGLPDVCAWVQEQYAPLIAAARRSYDECVSTKNYNTNLFRPIKRPQATLDSSSAPLLKKIRLSNRRSSPQSTLMAQCIINRMKSKGKVKLYLPTKKAKSPIKMPLHSCEMSTPETPRASPLVIDLTTDSDGDGVPPNAIQVCKPTVKPLSSPPMNHSDSATLSKPLPQPDTARQTYQNSCNSLTFHWPPKEGTSPTPPVRSRPSLLHQSLSPFVPRPIAKLPARAMYKSSRRLGVSLPQESNNTHLASGSHENPIIISDSDSE